MKKLLLKSMRKAHEILTHHSWRDESRVIYRGQKANDYVSDRIMNVDKAGLMITKFGTTELANITCCKRKYSKTSFVFGDYVDFVRGKGEIFQDDCLDMLCNLSGFFPKDYDMQIKFVELAMNDIKDIDILGSYINYEDYLEEELNHTVRIDMEGYYAPYLWERPWTRLLKNKKVLVVHPFAKSIEAQYAKREALFDDPDVLPEFASIKVIQAVQSIAGNGEKTGYRSWFEALDHMKEEINASDYDVALIGCGAYGMPLAAHVKRQGKIAVHMAGWLQMLFGIYGNRWNNERFGRFIKNSWIRPSKEEKPNGAEKVEGGCYW